MNRNILQHFQGYELLIRQLEEGVYRYERDNLPVPFDFMAPDSIRVIRSYLGDKVPYELFGGYDESFKKRLVIGEYLQEDEYISCLTARFNPRFIDITHRDVLGALYHSGIDENRFGDLWVEDDHIYVYVCKETASMVINTVDRIKRASVTFKESDSFPVQQFHFKERTVTVSSYRLDKILSQMIRKSREKAQLMIKGGLVNINYQAIEDCDFLCHNGDIVSVRGFGRYQIGEELAETKSGNVVIVIRQFI